MLKFLRFLPLAAAFSCSVPPKPGYPPDLPAKRDAARPDRIVDAIQVWRLGRAYLEGTPGDDSPVLYLGAEIADRFAGLDGGAACRFLDHPYLRPAASFGCVSTPHPYEDALEEALRGDDPVGRLQALVVLMRVSAPRSVGLQWDALRRLEGVPHRPGLDALLADLRGCFSERAILDTLRREPPQNRYRDDEELSWNVRAAGVLRIPSALPRLIELSRGDNLDVSLAAELSLEDFPGALGDEALVRCLLGWRYDAYVRAGRALLARDKELLCRTLAKAVAPADCRYWQGLLLAKCDFPGAVPILCESLPTRAIIDREMFDEIARLARPEHLPLLRRLPDEVRPEQRARAIRVRDEALQRLAPH